jgi:hypothetical protein
MDIEQYRRQEIKRTILCFAGCIALVGLSWSISWLLPYLLV